MLYLSRLCLDPRSAQVRAELRSPYEMHRTLAKAFAPPSMPEAEAKRALQEARVLFRTDLATMRATVIALVQSRRPPDWTQLTASSGYLAAPPETKGFEPCFRAGQLLAFRLRANPTAKRAGRRYGLYREEDQVAWLGRKARQGGFVVEQSTPLVEQHALRAPRKGVEVEHFAVRFDGVLRVADCHAFAETLASGIGSAKSFGFGLLSVALANS